MPYVVEDYYLAGMPQTALVGGLASRGIGEHWTAGRPGREGARATARWMVETADRNASYHELHWWEAGTRSFGVLRIVPSTRAAHSFNPNPPTWAPNAEVRRILGDRVGDPNAVTYACSFAGMPADLVAAMKDPYFVECEVRRRRELLAQENTIKVDRPLFNHGWGQPTTRVDAGDALIPAIYRGLYPQEADPMFYFKPSRGTVRAGAKVHETPGGAELATMAGGPGVVLGEIPAGAPEWLAIAVGARSQDFGRPLALAVPDKVAWLRRSDFTFAASPMDKAFIERIGRALYTDEAFGGISLDEHREAVASASLSGFSAGRSKAIAAYTAGGTKAAQEVTP